MSNKTMANFLEELTDAGQGSELIQTLLLGTGAGSQGLKNLKGNERLEAFLDELAEIEIETPSEQPGGVDAAVPTNEAERLKTDFYGAITEAEIAAFKRGYDVARMVNGQAPVFGRLPEQVSEWLKNMYGLDMKEGEE